MKSWLTLGAFGSWVACALLGVYAAGALILWSVEAPMSHLRAGLLMDYWRALDRPAFRVVAEGVGFTAEEKTGYAATMSATYSDGADDRSFLQSHLIGKTGHYYARDLTGAWSEVEHVHHALGSEPFAHDVKNPRERERLEETYQLREERAKARDEFVPGDRPERLPSPHPLAGHSPAGHEHIGARRDPRQNSDFFYSRRRSA